MHAKHQNPAGEKEVGNEARPFWLLTSQGELVISTISLLLSLPSTSGENVMPEWGQEQKGAILSR